MDTLRDRQRLRGALGRRARSVADVGVDAVVLARPARPRHRPHRLQGRVADALAAASWAPRSPASPPACRRRPRCTSEARVGERRRRGPRRRARLRRRGARRSPSTGPRSSSTWPRSRSCGARSASRARPTRPTSWARSTCSRPCAQAGVVRAIVNVTTDKCYENREQGAAVPRGRRRWAATTRTRAPRAAPSWWRDAYRRSFFADADGPRLASARAGNVIGGGDWGEDRLIPDIVRAALAGRGRSRSATRSAIRPWQHVLDPLSGYLRLAAGACGAARRRRGGWNFGPADGRRAAGVVDRRPPRRAVAGRAALGGRPGPAPARGRTIWRSTRRKARDAARLGAGLRARRRAREHRRVVRGAARRRRDMRARHARADRRALGAIRLPFRADDDRPAGSAALRSRPCSPTSACRRWRTPTCRRSAPTRWSPSIRCTRSSAAQCLLVQLEEFETPEEIFSDYAYFSSYSTSWLEHSRRYVEADDRALRPRRRRARSSSSPPTTATCCSTSSSAGIPVLGIEPAANVAERRRREGHPDARRVLRRARPRARWPSERRADLLLGNNVLAHVPDLNDFVAGMKVLLKPRRRDHDGVPAPAAADRGEPVRHDLPRALLVLLVPDRAHACSRPTACGCSTSRSCRRTAARCASTAATPTTTAKPETERARELLGARATRPGSATLETYRAFAERVAATTSAQLLELPDRAQARRASRSPATARRPRATRCSTTAASAPTSSTTRSTRTRTSRASLLPGHAHPDPPARGAARDAPDVVLILPWNLTRRDHRAARLHPRVGRAVRRARARAARCCRDPPPRRRSPACYVVEPERIDDERGFFARTWTPRSSPRTGSSPRRADEHVVQRARRHAARPALPGRAARGGQARALHARRDLRRGRRPARGTRRPTGDGTRSS